MRSYRKAKMTAKGPKKRRSKQEEEDGQKGLKTKDE